MAKRYDTSIFDVIGPIMVGPSSSHTAGAIRLGLLGRGLLGRQPEKAQIELHGSFAQTGSGHGTDKALVAGLMGMGTDNPAIRNSLQIARKRGLSYSFEPVDLGEDAHPNSVRMTLNAGGEQINFVGSSVGGGMITITQVQGYDVQFNGAYETLLVQSVDQPGTISTITGWLSSHRINVAFLRVERTQRGGKAMMIIEVDHPLQDQHIAAIQQLEWVSWVRKLPRLKD